MRKLWQNLLFKDFWQASYLGLFIILFVCIFCNYGCITQVLNQNICHQWLQDFSLNLLAEVIGIFLVLILVNRSLAINQEQEKQKFRRIAFRSFKIILQKQFYLFFHLLKASSHSKPHKKYLTIYDLFDENYFDLVGNLDLLTTAPVRDINGQPRDWLDYLLTEFANLKVALYKVLDRYSFCLDSEVVDVVEQLADAGLITFISVLGEAKRDNQIEFRGDLLSECRDYLIEYSQLFIQLVDIYNQSALPQDRVEINSQKWQDLWSYNLPV
ncbi:hypothetical protein [Merismopedia glauca]|uniref:DUF4760 domain-containing protein n=1 Tax=Merismopedia glauca CCAP 1448/3 TaxID=1296344 RepID=A0A2T1C0Y4_9CYAN|nr:hypothetical protein [Merismopedia glauca]PSB01902.1 hypothetical protein C7B64_15920 [Merismopedia glauca CCAP 1448/3]